VVVPMADARRHVTRLGPIIGAGGLIDREVETAQPCSRSS
jgi:hypothetical protein